MTTHNPIDTARETLKQLTQRKLLPTPDNFERLYCEISGLEPELQKNKLAELLFHAFEKLPVTDSSYKIALTKLRKAIQEEKWELVPQLVMDLSEQHQRSRELNQHWGPLILELIKAWDTRHPDMGQRYKQSALERVIATFGNNPQELNEKLANLARNWLQPEDPSAAQATEVTSDHAADNHHGSAATEQTAAAWRDVLVYALRYGVAPRLVHYPDLVPQLEEVQQQLQLCQGDDDLTRFFPVLRSFLIRLELLSQEDERLVAGLANLMRLMLQNVAELNRGDSYLIGQISSLQAILAQPNISIQHIYHLESSLKEVIHKQGSLRSSLDEATDSLRALLDTFLNKLSLMSSGTGQFQQQLQAHSERIRSASDGEALNSILQELLQDTASMQDNLQSSQQDLQSAQQEVESAQSRIRELEQALEAASAKIKEDQLTGAYNRRGLEEHFTREISRAERSGQPLSVALLDVDNFKQVNDSFGHLTGDNVLKYLVDMIRHCVRASDIVGRFGGEEFIVLLPDTAAAEAVDLMQRLQRELTKNIFLTGTEKLVVTFSAGVAEWHRGEQDVNVVERADRAMYQAKLAGKNRTLSAES